ncbi:hypothetical protein [Serratia proteamaculans]|nr:hypothetical protein [Serratia proteamaculans]
MGLNEEFDGITGGRFGTAIGMGACAVVLGYAAGSAASDYFTNYIFGE